MSIKKILLNQNNIDLSFSNHSEDIIGEEWLSNNQKEDILLNEKYNLGQTIKD